LIQSLLQVDANLSARLRVAEKPGRLRNLAIFLAHSGDGWFIGPALLAIFVFADWEWKVLAVKFAFGAGLVGLMVQLVKVIVRRKRPEGEWGAVYRKADPHSFPSGHTARMAILIVMSASLAPTWLFILLLIWGPLVALARVAMGVHYLSDIVGGALLGIILGLIVTLTPFFGIIAGMGLWVLRLGR
jgi:membrane-associated phospholipid phosphatase